MSAAESRFSDPLTLHRSLPGLLEAGLIVLLMLLFTQSSPLV